MSVLVTDCKSIGVSVCKWSMCSGVSVSHWLSL